MSLAGQGRLLVSPVIVERGIDVGFREEDDADRAEMRFIACRSPSWLGALRGASGVP